MIYNIHFNDIYIYYIYIIISFFLQNLFNSSDYSENDRHHKSHLFLEDFMNCAFHSLSSSRWCLLIEYMHASPDMVLCLRLV